MRNSGNSKQEWNTRNRDVNTLMQKEKRSEYVRAKVEHAK